MIAMSVLTLQAINRQKTRSSEYEPEMAAV
jgi:hypothetical protein